MTAVGKVWSKFTSTNKDGRTVNFVVREWTDHNLDALLQFCLKHYVTRECVHVAAGIPKSKEALREYQAFFSYLISAENSHIVACYIEDGPDANAMVGYSAISIHREEENFDFEPVTPQLTKLIEMIVAIDSTYDVFEKHALTLYYDDRSMCVHPEYSGFGIAQEFFKVRRMVCKERNVPITVAWMTAYGTQKAAERDGWEAVFEINISEFECKMGVKFEDAPSTLTFMIARVN